MPKIAGREVRGEFLTLQLFEVGKAVTPSEINDHVGRGDYAAKYISFLRGRHGFEFSVQKDGRTAVSYTLVSEPDNAADVRAKATAAPAAKAVAAAASQAKAAAAQAAAAASKAKAATKSASAARAASAGKMASKAAHAAAAAAASASAAASRAASAGRM